LRREKYVRKNFPSLYNYPANIIKTATVGFMSADPLAPSNPSYRQVCSGVTGHVEVLYVEIDEAVVIQELSASNENMSTVLRNLFKFFYMFHDPTTRDRQGNDAGTQYASWIFYGDKAQEKIAQDVTNQLQNALYDKTSFKNSPYFGNKIITQIHQLMEFYPAHAEHQEYLMKNPNGYCNHFIRFKVWPIVSDESVKEDNEL